MSRTLALGLIVSLAVWAPVEARELHWAQISVEAGLDADGRLHVAERQEMVFTGDWNGGERTFNLRMRQVLDFEGLSRIDDAGQEHVLKKGDLTAVDRFHWVGSKTIRWRSRLPSDPPFDRTRITYVLRYTLSNVLIPWDGQYLLDHDFLFPDREGIIERYSIRLSLDPVWQPRVRFPENVSGGPLPPGRGYVLTLPLTYGGPGKPRSVWTGAGLPVRMALAALLAVLFVFHWVRFYCMEKSLGRFEPLLPARDIDESWLQENVFSLAPEVVGAAWDEKTGAPEVAAVLARMVSEGKLESEIKTKGWFLFRRHVLTLKLLVDRSRLQGYEKDLVEALFVSGDTTDADTVRRHYGSNGFDPAAEIREPLRQAIRSLGGEELDLPGPSWKAPVGLALSGLALLAGSVWLQTGEVLFAGGTLVLAANAAVWAMVLAARSRQDVARPLRSFFPFGAILFASAAGALFVLLTGAFRASAPALAGATLLCIAMVQGALALAQSRQGPNKILIRKKLAAAREWFRRELAKRAPTLRDEWYPYLLAFGLGPEVDRWFRAYGGTGVGSDAAGRGVGGASSAGQWTGGGGAFGGGGASGSWAAAAGAMAAGVSSSSSGGGGGGGSSGGGGGGGW